MSSGMKNFLLCPGMISSDSGAKSSGDKQGTRMRTARSDIDGGFRRHEASDKTESTVEHLRTEPLIKLPDVAYKMNNRTTGEGLTEHCKPT